MKILLVTVFVISALTGAVFGLIEYGKALGHAESQAAIIELQEAISVLGLVINKTESVIVEKNRTIASSEAERINHVEVISVHADQLADLQRLMDERRSRHREEDLVSAEDAIGRVLAVDAANILRVYDEARSSNQLPESVSSGVLQKRLPEITTDDISTVIKRTAGEYNQCAIKYNQLWRRCDYLIEQKEASLVSVKNQYQPTSNQEAH